MKISCQSCHSKYNVADEKVQGKIVKIRCRKCGATIVVNGTGTSEAETNGAAETGASHGSVAGDAAQWHVNVAENDQRTLTIGELVEAYNSGLVTQDTFIWTDGMDDWKPLAEVETVVAALQANVGQTAPIAAGGGEPEAPAQQAAPAQEPSAAAYEPRPDEAPVAAAPAYDAPAPIAAPAAEPRRAAVAKREARARDLFATNAGEELHTGAPASPAGMSGGDGGLTGQRNENSVLFSLAVLTQSAEARGVVDRPSSGKSNTEDSGLIDLKALAAKAESMRPPTAFDGDVFHAPLGIAAAPLGTPVGALSAPATEQPKSKLPLFIGASAGVLVLLVLGIVIGVKLGGSSPTPAPTVVVTTVTTPTAEPPGPASAAADPAASAAPAASVATSPRRVVPAGVAGGTWHPPPAGPKPGPGVGGSGGGPTPAPTPAPAPKKAGGDCGCNGDLMCLMKCSTH